MEVIQHLLAGFGAATTAGNLTLAVVGALIGSLVVSWQRLGVMTALALLLPVAQTLSTLPALILLAGVLMGSHQRASNPAVPHSRGAAAAGFASFACAGVGLSLLALLVQPLATVANRLGPADWVALLLLTLVAAVVMTSDSLLRGSGMALLGLLLAQIGTDPESGPARYTLGVSALSGGIPLLALAVGLYAIGPAIVALRSHRPLSPVLAPAPEKSLSRWRPWLDKLPQMLSRSGLQGLRKIGAATALLPLFSFGLPFNAPLSLLFVALTLHRLRPGPELARAQPDLFWGVVVSLGIGCAALVVLQLPALRLASVRLGLARHAEGHAIVTVVVFAAVGLYAMGGGPVALWLGVGIGVMAAVFHRLGCPTTPLLVAFLLAPALQANLGRALLLSDGDWRIFVTRPVASALLLIAALVVGLALLPLSRKRRRLRFHRR